jgi:hypothetical protein
MQPDAGARGSMVTSRQAPAPATGRDHGQPRMHLLVPLDTYRRHPPAALAMDGWSRVICGKRWVERRT